MKQQDAPVYSTMSLRDLKNLIRSGEGLMLEFKRDLSSPEKIAREIAAFANTHGGYLLIGVDDDRSIIGVESYHEQDFFLQQAALELCDPPLEFKMEIIPYNGREVLLVYFNESKNKPVYVLNEEGREVYVRLEDESVRASPERRELLRAGQSKQGVTFKYGNNEQKLFRYLNEYPSITVNQYASLADINRKRASRILIDLTTVGILRIFRKKQTDFFSLAP